MCCVEHPKLYYDVHSTLTILLNSAAFSIICDYLSLAAC